MLVFSSSDKFVIDDYIKDVFISFYRYLFGQNESEFKYDPDKTRTNINIADQFSFDDSYPEFKPTLYIRRHPFSFMNTSIDQLMGANLASLARLHSDMLAGSIEIVAVSENDLEANRLASLVFMLTNQFKAALCAKSGLFKIEVKTLGESQPLTAASTLKLVEVPVLIQIMFQYTWEIDRTDVHPFTNVEVGRSNDLETGEHLKPTEQDNCSCSKDNPSKHMCIPITEKDPPKNPEPETDPDSCFESHLKHRLPLKGLDYFG